MTSGTARWSSIQFRNSRSHSGSTAMSSPGSGTRGLGTSPASMRSSARTSRPCGNGPVVVEQPDDWTSSAPAHHGARWRRAQRLVRSRFRRPFRSTQARLQTTISCIRSESTSAPARAISGPHSPPRPVSSDALALTPTPLRERRGLAGPGPVPGPASESRAPLAPPKPAGRPFGEGGMYRSLVRGDVRDRPPARERLGEDVRPREAVHVAADRQPEEVQDVGVTSVIDPRARRPGRTSVP